MTTEEMIEILEGIHAYRIAAKLRAAEELAKKAEDVCMRRTVFTEQLGMALENYRKAGGGE